MTSRLDRETRVKNSKLYKRSYNVDRASVSVRNATGCTGTGIKNLLSCGADCRIMGVSVAFWKVKLGVAITLDIKLIFKYPTLDYLKVQMELAY